MDDPNEENIEDNWVIVNFIDVAEEALELDLQINNDEEILAIATKENNGITEKESINIQSQDNESDLESDGISIISESSHLHDTTTDDENLQNEVDEQEFISKDVHSIDNSPNWKASWMFVDSCASSPEVETSKQFYLNCLQEPVHELSENELGSVQSDLESDGISIISECDSSMESFEETTQICQDTIITEILENDKLEYLNKLPNFIKKYFNGFLIGTILLASSSIFLGHYFNSVDSMDDDLPIYKEDFKNEIQELSDNIHEIQEKYDVPTALAYCSEQHKSDDIFMEQNVEKCLRRIENRIKKRKDTILVKEQMQKLEKYLRIKEKYLDEKEKFLIKREFEILKAELNIECNRLQMSKFYAADIVESGDITDGGSRLTTKEKKSDNSAKTVVNKNRLNDEYMRKKYNNRGNKYSKGTKNGNSKIYKYLNKCKDKENCVYENMKYLGGQKRDKRQSTEHFKLNERKYPKIKMENNKINKQHSPLDTEKMNDKHSCQEDGNQKFKNKKNKVNESLNYILVENKNQNESVNGYWVGKRYKARNDLRNKHNSGDWYFDRAFYRKRKRDKAKWYFDWMMDREILRYKRTSHI